MMLDKWQVLLTAGKHFTSYQTLAEASGVDVELYTPQMATSTRIRHTKKRVVSLSPAFPGYFFARGDVAGLHSVPWITITPLLIAGEERYVSNQEIDGMRSMEAIWLEEAKKGDTNVLEFKLGSRVTITDGVLKDYSGTVEAQDGVFVNVNVGGVLQTINVHCRLLTSINESAKL